MTNPLAQPACDPSQPMVRSLMFGPLGKFCGATLLGAFGLVMITHLLFPIDTSRPIALGVLAYLVAASLAAFGLYRTYPHAALGLCNLVTLFRLVLIGVLTVAVIAGIAPSWLTFALAAVTLALDGVDGWLARKQGLSSAFGARFDVEVDAVFALLLAVYAATNGAAGVWVILLGLPHYMFWIARLMLPWLNQDLPDKFSRKAVCVLQIATLIALQVPVLAYGTLAIMVAVATLALAWSFGRDILWLYRTQE